MKVKVKMRLIWKKPWKLCRLNLKKKKNAKLKPEIVSISTKKP